MSRITLFLSCQEYPADLDSIIISTAELGRRSSRPPDHAARKAGLLALARELATSPRGALQKLAETALSPLPAQSACVSLLTTRGRTSLAGCRWAVGLLLGRVGTPRLWSLRHGPRSRCSRKAVFPPRAATFTYLAEVKPYIEEGLLSRSTWTGRRVGTIWVVNHDGGRQFDAEDMRLCWARIGRRLRCRGLPVVSRFDSAPRQRATLSPGSFERLLPAAVYTTDAAGRVAMFTMFNEAAATFAGRTPFTQMWR